jgi:hypothetical protein
MGAVISSAACGRGALGRRAGRAALLVVITLAALAAAPGAWAFSHQFFYFSDATNNTIGVANDDGTAANASFITGTNTVHGIAVDGQHIYWTNSGSNTIGVANLDGTAVNLSFITGLQRPAGVAIDGSHIFWSNAGGTTFGVANIDGTSINNSLITGASSPAGVAVSVPVAQLTPASPPAFATTPRGTLSRPHTLTISNSGQRNLTVTGLSFTGSDPGDFIISANGCLGPIAPGESCRLQVRFAPEAKRARSATLNLATSDYANSPLAVPLSGAGGRLLITCRTVVKKARGHRSKVWRCIRPFRRGTLKSTTTAASDRAMVSRGRTMYATGVGVPIGKGRWQLLLNDLRPLPPGRYAMTLRGRRGRRITRHVTIQIG